jgi:hypothetical protein
MNTKTILLCGTKNSKGNHIRLNRGKKSFGVATTLLLLSGAWTKQSIGHFPASRQCLFFHPVFRALRSNYKTYQIIITSRDYHRRVPWHLSLIMSEFRHLSNSSMACKQQAARRDLVGT